MSSHEYHFITHWDVEGSSEEVFEASAKGLQELHVSLDSIIVAPVGSREPESRKVHADDAEMAAERLGPGVPGVKRRARTVEQHERETLAFVPVVDRQAVVVARSVKYARAQVNARVGGGRCAAHQRVKLRCCAPVIRVHLRPAPEVVAEGAVDEIEAAEPARVVRDG